MDEQAGPGVFFSGNNSSSLPGGVRAPQPGDGEAAAARAQFSVPGILHFLQHEWARFEVERAQSEVERAELQAQISFLQGERRGQENLKKDLVRRIKMLEFALKQERAKYHKLKYGTELNQGEIRAPSYDSDEGNDSEAPSPPNSSHQLGWKQGRQLLRQYLQEVGYTDTILDVKSQRVRALLGLTGRDQTSESKTQLMVNGTEPSSKPDVSDSAAALEAFKFIESAAAEFSDEDEEEEDDSEGRDKTILDLVTVRQHTRCSSSRHSQYVSTSPPPVEKDEQSPVGELSWDVDQGLIAQLKEQYRKERKCKKGVKRPNRAKLQDMLANLRDAEDLPSLQPPTTVNPPLAYDISNNQDALRKTWNPKFTLRSHFDSVRSLAFHPVEPVLVTASEDQTLKLWNLQKTAPAKKCAALDVEPIYTFRGHSGAVLCVTMSASGEQCFSGGVDGTIQSWNTPNPNVDPYDSYESSVLRGALCGHTDSVWGVVYSPASHRLLSCSADGTVRLWDAASTAPSLAVFNERGELGVPTSVDVVSSDPAHMVTSFSTGHIGLFNMETQQLVLKLDSAGPPGKSSRINKVLSHPTLPITVTAQEDRHIQFFDNNTGKLIHSMVAHLDSVTCLAVDPNGLYLMSGSHDCSIRLWNMESKTCIQEFTAHRKKSEESIHAVAFHPTKCYIGSAGADALAKVFV
uniref:Striatin N-terminal domain-containing protein n=1 Tax=Scophthalmus maximus TaxID=52904 RepID=A0A8D3BHD9_SCOMX